MGLLTTEKASLRATTLKYGLVKVNVKEVGQLWLQWSPKMRFQSRQPTCYDTQG